jgi:hypothetical protein
MNIWNFVGHLYEDYEDDDEEEEEEREEKLVVLGSL